MKKIRFVSIVLVMLTLSAFFIGCGKEEDKPKLTLDNIVAIADRARELDIEAFEPYEYIILGSDEIPLYYFTLNNIDFSFSVVLDENGNIETMILSHVSGSDLYLFHTNPGKLDANAEPYEGVANSYDVEKFIKKMMED